MKSFQFAHAVSADLQQLQADLGFSSEATDLHEIYMRVRLHYLSGETELLQEYIQKYKSDSSALPWMIRLMEYRLCIRQKSLHPEEKESLLSLKQAPGEWPAEIQMVLGMYCEDHKRYAEATQYYSLSARLFEKLDLKEKSLSAEYNALIAQTQAQPERRYLVAYNSFIVRALAANHKGLAAVALANFSREYQLLGLKEVALEKAEQAIDLLKESHFGTLHYFLTVAQCLDLLVLLNRKEKAKRLYEDLLSSPYKEVGEIVKVLQRYCETPDAPAKPVDLEKLPMPWAERALKISPGLNLGDRSHLEAQLIEILVRGPQSLSELAILLYGDKIDHESATARTKQAIYRLRKKAPHFIALRKGRYEVVD